MRIFYNEEVLEDDEVLETPTEVSKRLRLKEDIVDFSVDLEKEDYLVLKKLREVLGEESQYPISFLKLEKILKSIYKALFDRKVVRVNIVQILLSFWRGGEIRRFYKGTGWGQQRGIHYVISKENNENN